MILILKQNHPISNYKIKAKIKKNNQLDENKKDDEISALTRGPSKIDASGARVNNAESVAESMTRISLLPRKKKKCRGEHVFSQSKIWEHQSYAHREWVSWTSSKLWRLRFTWKNDSILSARV